VHEIDAMRTYEHRYAPRFTFTHPVVERLSVVVLPGAHGGEDLLGQLLEPVDAACHLLLALPEQGLCKSMYELDYMDMRYTTLIRDILHL
jgi:hypothetical protein